MPNDTDFQKKVLITLLELLERPEGPVILEDYPLDAPESEEEPPVLSCPVRFDDQTADDSDPLKSKFLREIQAMRPWYDMALKKRGRTSLGGSGMDIDHFDRGIAGEVKGVEIDVTDISGIHRSPIYTHVLDIIDYRPLGRTSFKGLENSEAIINRYILFRVELLQHVCHMNETRSLAIIQNHRFIPSEAIVLGQSLHLIRIDRIT